MSDLAARATEQLHRSSSSTGLPTGKLINPAVFQRLSNLHYGGKAGSASAADMGQLLLIQKMEMQLQEYKVSCCSLGENANQQRVNKPA